MAGLDHPVCIMSSGYGLLICAGTHLTEGLMSFFFLTTFDCGTCAVQQIDVGSADG